ncbi:MULTISPECIES: inorganic phosphate transporter [Brevibacillus]|uniref:Inorganic phosphate transporter n=1 Tax=Brevibacillus invocatus TaxID=173959 RepID=A0A3M8CFM8_9BACL|nr:MULTISPECIES: inorganic phosphate transporter [Brevibacillus]MCM3078773.1 inorganic phosphate transporter [Brevibacillus invocatus]MCM3428861.1 inorganic phosphate transporter [Brevibacillus invocatus]MDH4616349.1 inorganic phosphate transporter [Brevibacillus sp. AY1]RNB74546.1 inorganic phosphate transporter [Brevibacillus invocatus]
MDTGLPLVVMVVILAVSFDFINGFHDTANAIATTVSTKALPPKIAIALAASMNFIGALTFTGVAKTIGGSIADPAKLEFGVLVVIAALLSAITWNLVTWWYGIPSSSSHALIGSLAGAVIASAGFGQVNWDGFTDIFKALILSPIIALVAGYLLMNLLYLLFSRVSTPPTRINRGFRFFQIFTAALQSFTHGTNDAQKAMGIIVFALVAAQIQEDAQHIPFWVQFICALAMGLGTSVGGWKIIKTVGGKITKIEPINGATADLTSSSIIFTFTQLGLPVSSTHVISSAIMGVGAAKRFKNVNWGVAKRIVITWFITLPISAIIASLFYYLLVVFF